MDNKNIHVLPTYGSSRLHNTFNILRLEKGFEFSPCNLNLYITSNESAKHAEWCFYEKDKECPVKFQRGEYLNAKKIILTTDLNLIALGVQAIDDEFLQWFVNNSSCGYIHLGFRSNKNNEGKSIKQWYPIIPKEESKQDTVGKQFYETTDMTISVVRPKQETIEEVAERLYPTTIDSFTDTGIDMSETERLIFINGVKWQQENILQLLKDNDYQDEPVFELLTEQFKKK